MNVNVNKVNVKVKEKKAKAKVKVRKKGFARMVVAERQYGEVCAMRGRVQTLQEGPKVIGWLVFCGNGFAEGGGGAHGGGGDVYN